MAAPVRQSFVVPVPICRGKLSIAAALLFDGYLLWCNDVLLYLVETAAAGCFLFKVRMKSGRELAEPGPIKPCSYDEECCTVAGVAARLLPVVYCLRSVAGSPPNKAKLSFFGPLTD